MTPRAVVAALALAGAMRTSVAFAAEDERLLYSFMFGGLRAGEVLIALHETDTGYHAELRATVRGVLKSVLGDFRVDLTADGGQATPSLQPRTFRRAWAAGPWASAMTVSFDPATHVADAAEQFFNPLTGAEVERDAMPFTRRGHPPRPLAESSRTGVLDPMAAFTAGRAAVRAAHGSAAADTRLPVFDGRHRYDVVVTPGGAKDEEFAGVTHRVVQATVHVEPAGGFEGNYAARTREGEGHIAFSADSRFIPLQIMVTNSLGAAVFNFAADCRDDAARCEAFTKATDVSAP